MFPLNVASLIGFCILLNRGCVMMDKQDFLVMVHAANRQGTSGSLFVLMLDQPRKLVHFEESSFSLEVQEATQFTKFKWTRSSEHEGMISRLCFAFSQQVSILHY